MKSKLSLGTAQFGMAYPAHHQIPRKEADEILNLAWYYNIEHVDTAACYGNAEEIIAQHPMPFKITTKEGKHKSKLNENVYAVLLHDGMLPYYWEVIEKYPVKVGLSMYNLDEVDNRITTCNRCDIVQVPYSLHDQRWNMMFPKLSDAGIEIQVRSVFNRGRVFEDPNLEAFAQANGFTTVELALNFALMNSYIDRVIVGVDNLEQLEEIIKAIDAYDRVRGIKEHLKQFAKEGVSYG